MKKSIHLLCFLLLIMVSLSANSQKYRTAADTVKLNKEYVNVSNDIADLTAQLTIAQNNLPGYENKAANAGTNAQDAAAVSSDQAAKATNGSIKDARSAKRKAKTAYKEAKDAKSASNNVSDQDNKIADLTFKLNKKQERLQQLQNMRTAINAQASQR